MPGRWRWGTELNKLSRWVAEATNVPEGAGDEGVSRIHVDAYDSSAALRQAALSAKHDVLRHRTGAAQAQQQALTQQLLDEGGEQSGDRVGAPAVEPPSDIAGLKYIILQWSNCLLILIPLAMGNWGFGITKVFFLNLLCLVPLSQLLSEATEQLVCNMGSASLGALINASLNNATEMIVTVTSLRAGLYSVVKSAMLGSILSNLLAVLGVTIMAMGFKNSKVVFRVQEPIFSCSLLLLGSMSFVLPTLFFYSKDFDDGSIVSISRAVSVVTAITYAAYVLVQMLQAAKPHEHASDEQDYEQEALVSLPTALALLGVVTFVIGLVSDKLVDSIQALEQSTGLTPRFVGVILLPVAGNVQGALQGIVLARRGGTNVAIALAMSGSTQVALLVLPFAVLAGWCMDKPMDLKFDFVEVCIMILSVLVAFSIVVDGRASWLHGLLLLSSYLTITILFWHV